MPLVRSPKISQPAYQEAYANFRLMQELSRHVLNRVVSIQKLEEWYDDGLPAGKYHLIFKDKAGVEKEIILELWWINSELMQFYNKQNYDQFVQSISKNIEYWQFVYSERVDRYKTQLEAFENDKAALALALTSSNESERVFAQDYAAGLINKEYK